MVGYIHQQQHVCRQFHVVQLHRYSQYFHDTLNAYLQFVDTSSHKQSSLLCNLQES